MNVGCCCCGEVAACAPYSDHADEKCHGCERHRQGRCVCAGAIKGDREASRKSSDGLGETGDASRKDGA